MFQYYFTRKGVWYQSERAQSVEVFPFETVYRKLYPFLLCILRALPLECFSSCWSLPQRYLLREQFKVRHLTLKRQLKTWTQLWLFRFQCGNKHTVVDFPKVGNVTALSSDLSKGTFIRCPILGGGGGSKMTAKKSDIRR